MSRMIHCAVEPEGSAALCGGCHVGDQRIAWSRSQSLPETICQSSQSDLPR